MKHPPRRIGETRTQAIDWTQDTLATTRPIAGRMVAEMLSEGLLVESPYGLILFEADDELERRARTPVKTARPRFRGMRTGMARINSWVGPASDMILAHRARYPDQDE